MKGREKCELLNQIRQKIADENSIDFTIYECTFEGDCTGNCPKCEAELKYLEAELAKKQARGEKIKLDGIFTLDFDETCPIDEPNISSDEIQVKRKIYPEEELLGDIAPKDIDYDY